jgi:hypothetical protein
VKITSIKEAGPVKGCAQIAYKGFIISMSTVSLSSGLRVFEGVIGEKRDNDSDVTPEIFGDDSDAPVTMERIALAKAWIDIRIKNREAMNARAEELRNGSR